VGLALYLAGCAPRGDDHARVVEREETRGGERFVLRSEVRPARATLGDRIEWTLLADVPAKSSLVELRSGASDSTLEIAAFQPAVPSRRGDRDVWHFPHRVRPFDLGPRPLPATLALVYRGLYADTLAFPADTLFVDSLTTGPRRVLDADHGPLPTELRPIDLAVVGAAALLLALLAVLAVRAIGARRANLASVPVAPPEAPAVAYRRALGTLRSEAGALTRDVFYERLAAAVRAYVEGATGIAAPERTTRELQEELGLHPHLDPDTRAAVARTLARADLAKFARVTDETADALAALDDAAWLAGRLERTPAGAGAPPPVARDGA
jgi:hypothetical protein